MDDVGPILETIDGATEYEESTDTAIQRLAALPAIEYERCRTAEAQKLGIGRVSVLDDLVKQVRPKGQKGGQGRALELPDPEPWPEPVDGDDLLDQIEAELTRFLALPDGTPTAISLWILLTYCLDAFDISPRLAVTSPEKQCGKTTTFKLVSLMSRRPLMSSNISPAAVFRAMEVAQPTLFIDEGDSFMDASEELRGILNSGHDREAAYVIRTVGDDYEPRQFSTWGAVAIAAIGSLPGTLADRSIPVAMRRSRPDERLETFRKGDRPRLAELARMAWRWSLDNIEALESCDPQVPDSLYNRVADNWRPLLAIAEIAGGDWPARARQAAVTLSGQREETSIRTLLLSDIRDIIGDDDRITSSDLAARLAEMEDRPWPEFSKGKPITAARIARLLKDFGIRSDTIRFGPGTGDTAKGYKRETLRDAFSRYLPSQNVTTSQVNDSAAYSDFQNVTATPDVTFSNRPKATDSAGCDVVTLSNPQRGQEGPKRRGLCPHCGNRMEPGQATAIHGELGEIHVACRTALTMVAGMEATSEDRAQ